jgi:hypothetical protein
MNSRFAMAALASLGLSVPPISAAAASIVTFDNWTLVPFTTDRQNDFNAGPFVVGTSNILVAAFSNVVFPPGTPIVGFSNTGCVGLCSDFYYTNAVFLNLRSPSLNVIAGHEYSINFNVDASVFISSADYHVQIPAVQFTYLSPNSGDTGCGECALALLPSVPSKVSIDFVPTISGQIEFGLLLDSGLNPNGAASSSINPFNEGGFYLFSDLSVIDLSVPEPSTWAMMLIGFAGLGFAFPAARRYLPGLGVGINENAAAANLKPAAMVAPPAAAEIIKR